MNVDCEKCPISIHCKSYDEARKDNMNSYHQQDVVRVYYGDCPLVALIKPEEEKVNEED